MLIIVQMVLSWFEHCASISHIDAVSVWIFAIHLLHWNIFLFISPLRPTIVEGNILETMIVTWKGPHLLSHIIHPHFNWTCTASINIQHFSPHFILSTLRPIAKWNVRSVLCCQRRPVAAGWINREGTGKRNIGEEKSISHFARPGMPSSTWGLFIYKSPNESAL